MSGYAMPAVRRLLLLATLLILAAGTGACSSTLDTDINSAGGLDDLPDPPGAGDGGDGGGIGLPPGDSGGATGESVALPQSLQPDALYGVPTFTGSSVGSSSPEAAVRIVVLSGAPASPFQYVNCVGVLLWNTAHYVPHSFNVGLPGGEDGYPDGIWAAMNPAQGFLFPPDSFITETDAGSMQHRIDFNLTPLGGTDLSGESGALFNFGVWFESAGIYPVRFVEYAGVARTYYTSSSQDDNHYWGDVSNDHPGVLNYITVE